MKTLLVLLIVIVLILFVVVIVHNKRKLHPLKLSYNSSDGAGMVWVPAGYFVMGSDDLSREEGPAHKVYLDGYWIYRYEVTVAQYRKFCFATGRPMPPPPPWGWFDDHPIVNVTWREANNYAHWAKAELPTDAQWEKAARGTDQRLYPWGNWWDRRKCANSTDDQHRMHGTVPVGSYPKGVSPYGIFNMAGNASELCRDWYYLGNEYFPISPQKNPMGPKTGSEKINRGGSWVDSNDYFEPVAFHNTFRWHQKINERNIYTGFRCVVMPINRLKG